jgi:hypothetical protein
MHYNLYLSERGKNAWNYFREAVNKALDNAETSGDRKIKCNMEIVSSNDVPELSIIDYMIWALQRNLLQGESRFFDALKNKYATVINLYEE